MQPLIGRETELARLERFLDEGTALTLRGPRGVGVSALVEATAERATVRVLRAAGVQAESGFPYAGLDQLLRPLRRTITDPALRAITDAVPDPSDVAAALVELKTPMLVDDWQWTDPQTREALAAAARRGAQVLFAGHDAGPPGVEELFVGPLGVEAAQLLAPDVPLLAHERILREAAGYPLALRELPLAYASADDGALLGSWAPLTPALEEAFGLDADPAQLIAALDDGDDLAAAARLGGRPIDRSDPVFAHPLTRAAVRHAATPERRRAAHEAFALEVEATDPDRATWHRVVAASGPDAALADRIEAVSWRSLAAGDYERAAAGIRRAANLTPHDPARTRRFAAAAWLANEIGGVEVADRLLDEVVPEQLDVVGEARIATLRRRPPETLIALADEVTGRGERGLAVRLRWLASTELHARGEVAAVAEPDAPRTPGDHALLGYAAFARSDPHRAAALLDTATQGMREQRRRTPLAEVLALSAWAHVATSNLDRAHRDAEEAGWLCARVRRELWGAAAQAALATVAALRGEEAAERHAAEAERVALRRRASYVLALVQQARGAIALAAGRPAEAYAHLCRPFDPTDPAHDPVSAAILLGDLAEAAASPEFVRALVAAHEPTGPHTAVALAHATLVLADDEDADDAFAAAAIGEQWPFARARIQLVHGMRLRRARRMADSRAPLREAAAAFIALGCTPWAERAQRELAATVETASRDGAERLTPRELEIARLAARGLTNRAIAADLALSPRTVGHHLARIFPKLDVSSRAGVGAALEQHGY